MRQSRQKKGSKSQPYEFGDSSNQEPRPWQGQPPSTEAGVFGFGGDMGVWEQLPEPKMNEAELAQEAKNIRRLQIMVGMVISVIYQDPSLTLEQASEMVSNARTAALTMFPDKELAWNILYRPRLYRAIEERFRLQ